MTVQQYLLDQLTHPDAHHRSQAALALGNLEATIGLEALLTALTVESDVMVREDITWALVRKGQAAVEPLVSLLQHPQAEVRHHAAHVLGKLHHPQAIEGLCAALHDTSPIVVQKVAFALSQIRDNRALPALVTVLGHPILEVREALTLAITMFDEAALPHLHTAVTHPAWQTREHVMDILAHIHAEPVWDLLSIGLRDDIAAVRIAAVTAIGQQENRLQAARLLKPLSDDPDLTIRALAAQFLTRSTNPRRQKLPSL